MQPLPDASEGLIKLASNESAFGASIAAQAAARAAIPDLARYPEQGTGQLQHAIGECFELDPQRIVCGPGSDELLVRIVRSYLEPGQELVYSVHGYAKFANYAWGCGARPVAAPDNDFRADVEQIIAQVTARTRIVMLANPDNPTGTHLGEAELRRLRLALPEQVILVLDCAYAEYVDAHDYGNPARLVDEFANVIMTRTFSKIFGMAGARLGWVYAAPAVVEVLRRMGATFPISTLALVAGIEAARDRDHFERVRSENSALRAAFSSALGDAGVLVYPSQSNFVLANFGSESRARGAFDFLLGNGIVARRLGPAFADCLRITIGLPDEMALCLQHLLTYQRG